MGPKGRVAVEGAMVSCENPSYTEQDQHVELGRNQARSNWNSPNYRRIDPTSS